MARQPYIAGSAAPKRGYFDPQQDSQKTTSRSKKQSVEVFAGGNNEKAITPEQSFALRAAKATIAVILVLSAIGFGRIAFASATVSEALQAREINRNLIDMRSSINDMHVEESSLSNPVRIKNEAKALNMSTPSTIHVVDITGDLVIVGENGKLSLTKTLAAVADANASVGAVGKAS